MAVYPSSIPSPKTRNSADMSQAETHTAWHDADEGEIIAIAATLSTNPQGAFPSVKARLDDVDTRVVRRRSNRGAFNYATGDSDWNGTFNTDENVGGFTGAGTTASPFVVPLAGSYAVDFGVANGAFSGASAVGLVFDGIVTWLPIQPGTTNRSGGTIVKRLAASGTITLRVRNNSGATVNNVTTRCEIVKVAAA
jgi:hypothetical protein